MKHQIQVGERQFQSKKEALNYYKQILNSYNYGEVLSKNDFNEIFALLKTHPKVQAKIGIGNSKIKIK